MKTSSTCSLGSLAKTLLLFAGIIIVNKMMWSCFSGLLPSEGLRGLCQFISTFAIMAVFADMWVETSAESVIMSLLAFVSLIGAWHYEVGHLGFTWHSLVIMTLVFWVIRWGTGFFRGFSRGHEVAK